ncbi:plasmid pRiA4b ORF-3 family protein [Methylobacterium sp. BTF04]|uniref:plasmid pRiA4b ORF-3 family protein n=1 Tax=Methylobacterium sp. BTF04 TaxID=2708300 RepID=UPI0013D35BB6|nr:plasmid pRiA4b ORF-3 family protein [Methylobacterium sp. BTF04]NEU14598.1 plasmid pRiA4b ORF-3 family protein [Methylobacterium sp. BTF04]
MAELPEIAQIARLHISLEDIEPAIWRQVEVPLTSTLKALHDVIQSVFWRANTCTSSNWARSATGWAV